MIDRVISEQPSMAASKVQVPFSQRTIAQITSWTQTKKIEDLANLLEEEPAAIVHPIVRTYFRLLQQLARKEFIQIDSVPIHFLPLPKSREALSLLTCLAEAIVRGLFPPRWSVKINPPRGAPKQISQTVEFLLLGMFHTICRDIDEHPDAPLMLDIQTTDMDALIERVARLVQKIAPKTISLPSGEETPISVNKAREIAQHAVHKNKVSKRRLALSILAYTTDSVLGFKKKKSLKALESLIQRAEAKYPDLDLHRPSRQDHP